MMDKATIGQEVEYPGVTRLDNYMMDKRNGKAWQGTAVDPRLEQLYDGQGV